jgi:hypothetical protein
LETIFRELDGERTAFNIEILGINRIGSAPFNALAVAGRILPWLQDTSEAQVWTRWNIQYRDVLILGPNNEPSGVYNLTSHDLAEPANREVLKSMLRSAARMVDENSNGIPDAWERRYFGGLAGADDDPDRDGWNHFSEFLFGTDPREAASRPVLGLETVTGGGRLLHYRRFSGGLFDYEAQVSTNLRDWAPVTGGSSTVRNRFDGTGSSDVTVVLPNLDQPRAFFRVWPR